MRAFARICTAAILLLPVPAVWAQTPNLNPNVPPAQQIPVIKFQFELPGASPPHYSLSIEAGGAAAYRSDEDVPVRAAAGAETPYFLKFDVSPGTATRIFDLAKDLNFFQGDFEYRGGRIANMGAKTLTFKDGKHDNSFTYNFSQNPQLQQLTSLLQGIAASVEYRRQLERLYRFEKLGLEEELRQMQIDAKRGYLSELQVDEPILQTIVHDPTVLNISRKRAEQILRAISGNGERAGKK